MLALGNYIQPQYEFIGQEQTPIIIIDNYLSEPQLVINLAQNHSEFKPDTVTQYPGLRMPLPKQYVVDYLKPLIQGFYKVFKIGQTLMPRPKDNCLSLITKTPEQLSAVQTLPHFDTNDPNLIAIIHYLGEGAHGGTGFFRHKKTEFETINSHRKHIYLTHAQNYLINNSHAKPAYCTAQHSEFECYKSIPYKPNRLIVFPGYLLHSSLLDNTTDISSCPQTGRLTANMFVHFK
ncbi:MULTISPECIES: DUF6445 family protein [Aliiglaciecola]|uniref:DUF6445 family protein n=1 Tax=Aliiglaciecola TaxID=1406885 RepID=UPI001C09DE00|nr:MULTISPECIES: DUF6445 family protein [Aliiglaciecola]MBU2879895.1 hypothetical protein [Aliiglaciecola lipolytica]MDO6712421.1 DUF6445 family protein [Aliiglaciecola sp. 2_MG-2023]MDO6753415.1 DUF6445 family protein [Aliiglaciecola sp. 1_MG-2023]